MYRDRSLLDPSKNPGLGWSPMCDPPKNTGTDHQPMTGFWFFVKIPSVTMTDSETEVGKKLTRKQKGKLVMNQSRITSQYMTPWMDLIWTKTTQRSTLKKMFVTHSIVCMTHCICFVSVCTVKCTGDVC